MARPRFDINDRILTTFEEMEKLFPISANTMNAQRFVNTTRLRLRRILPHLVGKDPTVVAFEYINEVLKAEIMNEDIVGSYQIDPWYGFGKDIIVTFRDQEVRNRVYNKRTRCNGGLFEVCDELIQENMTLWKALLHKFGETNVITRHGIVCVIKEGKEKRCDNVDALKAILSV